MTRHLLSDWPLDAPPAAAHFCARVERTGWAPSGWFDKWAQSENVAVTDRVYYEPKTIVDALEYAGSYDQVNLGSLVFAELLRLRVQTIAGAYENNPSKPSFVNAKYFSGLKSLSDADCPDLKSFAARKAEEETEVEKRRQKARELRGKADGKGDKTGAAGGNK